MMTPDKARQQGLLIEIDHPVGGKRYPAHLFLMNTGIAWIEFGWTAPGLEAPPNPVHAVEGTLTENGKDRWQIKTPEGAVNMRVMRLAHEPDNDVMIALADMDAGSRQQAKKRVEEDLGITLTG